MKQIKLKYYFKHKKSGNIESKIYTLEEIEKGNILYYYKSNDYEIIDRCLWTGIEDIYQGDIVKSEYAIGVVKLGNISFSIGTSTSMFYIEITEVIERRCFTWAGDIYTEFKKFEAIGNIHDNPELIGSGIDD